MISKMRAMHTSAYRCGEWAVLTGVKVVSNRFHTGPVFIVTYPDGEVYQRSVYDSSGYDEYEFALFEDDQ